MIEGKFGRTVPKGLVGLFVLSGDALDTEDKDIDPLFDSDSSLKSDSDHIIDNVCEEQVNHLNRVLLGLFFYFQLTTVLGKGGKNQQSWLD